MLMWENLPMLKKLNLRKNKIEKFEEEMPPCDQLTYLNLRSNKISSMEQITKLFQYVNLVDINVLSNPLEKSFAAFNMFMSEILILNPKI